MNHAYLSSCVLITVTVLMDEQHCSKTGLHWIAVRIRLPVDFLHIPDRCFLTPASVLPASPVCVSAFLPSEHRAHTQTDGRRPRHMQTHSRGKTAGGRTTSSSSAEEQEPAAALINLPSAPAVFSLRTQSAVCVCVCRDTSVPRVYSLFRIVMFLSGVCVCVCLSLCVSVYLCACVYV